MIYERTMYSAKCDNCGKEALLCGEHVALTDKEDVVEDLLYSGWFGDCEGKNIQYCPDCYHVGDNDEILLLKIEK